MSEVCVRMVRGRPCTRPARTRGLCHTCATSLRKRHPDRLLEYPRRSWRGEDLVADAEVIRARGGLTWRQVAAELGVSFAALDKARHRVRARQTVA